MQRLEVSGAVRLLLGVVRRQRVNFFEYPVPRNLICGVNINNFFMYITYILLFIIYLYQQMRIYILQY